ncbi:MAG TPA: AAA family ATPase [Chitinophagaceae bacterium]|nr:AAA family ATPase [Chitinophagaceae bacterium]
MLKQLSIRNYAIIEAIDIKFPAGMNVITGETGAGKSIIMGALGLILGDRSDSSALLNKDRKCIVEGVFAADHKLTIKDFLKEHELDAEEELVLRREIAVTGKSRAFINDTPVNLELLRAFSGLLVDLHQQFDSLQLGENDFQREVIDALAGSQGLVKEYQAVHAQWKRLQKELEVLRERKFQFDKEADYNRFQFDELEEAAFRENELEETEAELKLLNNSEEIRNALSKVCFELTESETPIVQQLKSLSNQLQGYSSFHAGLPDLVRRLQSAQLELQDIAGDLGNIGTHINYSPQKIEQLNDRLASGYKLLKKHSVKTTSELLAIQKQFEEKLQAVLNIDEEIKNKEQAVAEITHVLSLQAKTISERRHKQVKPLEEKVNKLLV